MNGVKRRLARRGGSTGRPGPFSLGPCGWRLWAVEELGKGKDRLLLRDP